MTAPPDDLKRWRKETRGRLIDARMAAAPEDRRNWSVAIEDAVFDFLAPRPAGIFGLYWPFRAEFDPRPLAARLTATGWTTALPIVVAPKSPMEFHRWQPGDAMENGVWDIPIPAQRHMVLPDAVLAPVVGFDAQNYRLGYGGGFFDRTLAALSPRPLAIGVGFDLSRLETVFPQEYDIPMDVVVTQSLRPQV